MKKMIFVAIIIIALSLGTILGIIISPRAPVDATMTINTASPKVLFVDEGGKQLGSVEFDREVTLRIKRR